MLDTRAGLMKLFCICQMEKRKTMWPWHNTCQSICLRNMKMKQFFAAYQCGLPVRTSMKTDSVSVMVDDANITLTSLRIICKYIRDAFGKCSIFLIKQCIL